METQNNKTSKIGLIIVIAFAIGFSLAFGTFILFFYEDFFGPGGAKSEDPQVKCDINPTPCLRVLNGTYNTTIASEIGFEKVEFLKNLVKEPIIQNALRESNLKASKMDPDIRTQIYVQREKTWTTSLDPTPFMKSISENDVAKFLKDNHKKRFEKFGDLVFGEHILTNIYGPNVAVSVITDNYLQSNDDWWQYAINHPNDLPFARECEFDSSAQMFSEDLVIGIFDNRNQLIGIMNSATPCDVTQEYLDADKSIKHVPEEQLSEIGIHKISVLKEFSKNPIIQNALKQSNSEFSNYLDTDLFELRENQPWPNPNEEANDFQLSIINNKVADLMRNNTAIVSEGYGLLEFPEMILTNSKGITIASTDRTFNYVQFFEEWWIVAAQHEVLVRQCGWDRSLQLSSEDIIIQIYDENGNFIGIMNSASSCNVIDEKDHLFFGNSN